MNGTNDSHNGIEEVSTEGTADASVIFEDPDPVVFEPPASPSHAIAVPDASLQAVAGSSGGAAARSATLSFQEGALMREASVTADNTANSGSNFSSLNNAPSDRFHVVYLLFYYMLLSYTTLSVCLRESVSECLRSPDESLSALMSYLLLILVRNSSFTLCVCDRFFA